jgi:transcriptional regulator with XRE-family HTH domain
MAIPVNALPAERAAARRERKQRGLTQAQLAQTMGIAPDRVSQIERGELSTSGRLYLVANFTNHTLIITITETA